MGRVLRVGGGHGDSYLCHLALRILVQEKFLINAVQVQHDKAYTYGISDAVAKAAMMVPMVKMEVILASDVPGEPEVGVGQNSMSALEGWCRSQGLYMMALAS